MFSNGPSRDRTLEVHRDKCQARFVAWFGTEDDAETATVDVEKCALCGGDALKKDNFKDCVLRLWRGRRGMNRRYGPGVTLGVAGCLL